MDRAAVSSKVAEVVERSEDNFMATLRIPPEAGLNIKGWTTSIPFAPVAQMDRAAVS